MPRIVVRPMEPADLPAAARMLAERHKVHRRATPLLSPRYEDPEAALAEVTATWKTEGASGAVALAGDEVVGYLLGAPKPSPVWGPNLWIEAAGQAVRDAETVRDLYGVAAARWHSEGRTAHYVLTPSHDAALVAADVRGVPDQGAGCGRDLRHPPHQ